MKNWRVFIFCIMAVLLYSFSAYSHANSEINSMFGDEDEIEVIVVLKDSGPQQSLMAQGLQANELNAKKAMIGLKQDAVLNDLKLKEKNPDKKTNAGLKKEKITGISLSDSGDYDFELTNRYTLVNGFAGKIKKSGYEKLRNNPNILSIDKSKTISAFLPDSAGIINATRAWSLIYNGTNITGKGQSVCIIDTGVDYTHPALGNCSSQQFMNGTCSKVIGGYDFVNNDNNSIDDNGHGTHVAGIVASINDTNRGIAPDAGIVAIKVLNAAGLGSTANLISAIDWCTNNATIYNISVISLSLGINGYSNSTFCDTSDSQSLVNSIHTAIGRNISVVAAAGNDNVNNGVSSPACISNVTAVGSATKADATSSFSDRWGLPILFAPGTNIQSLKPSFGCLSGCSCSGNLMTCSGTSMAAPHISGAFALLRQYKALEGNITLTPFQLQNASNRTGKLFNDSSNGLTYARVNVYNAVLSLDGLAPNITINTPTPSNNSNFTINSSDSSIFFNLTADETISSSIIEISNGTKTNTSMNINGLNAYINLTSIKIGVRKIKIYVNDSAGNAKTAELTIQVNNTAPLANSSSPQNGSVSIPEPSNLTFSINFTDYENDSIIFSWYINNTLHLAGINKSEMNFTGNLTSAGFYIINATLYDGSESGYRSWNLSVSDNNRLPNITSANITNSDYLNRTNGTLLASWSFSDPDGGNITANETFWYINNTKVSNFSNSTEILSINTTKLENWTFSVRVFDGSNWSSFSNSSIITILNANPTINITPLSYEVLETQAVNITLNASDLDLESLSFSSNNTDFSISFNQLLWYTNITSSGTYEVNISVNDTSAIDFISVNVTVIDARDLDNDGNPDFNDTDDDNDGIDDENDFVLGNVSSINTTQSLNLTINGTSNLSRLFNGTFMVNVSNGTHSFFELTFIFNSSNIFDFGNITFNRTTTGSSAISIRGKLNFFNYTKTAYLEKINTTVKAVCIKDADADYANISSECNEANETLITCDNVTSEQYTCFDTGLRYKVTGLNHSAVKEQCTDIDGDGYGTGCSAGTDCNDNDSSKTTDCSSGSSGSSSGGGGSGGGGGGGGGGGAGLTYICSMEWQCDSWSACSNGWQTRNCDFIKVPQHVQNTSCQLESEIPQTAIKCEAIKQSGENQSSSSTIDENMAGTAQNIVQSNEEQDNKNTFVKITGALIRAASTTGFWIYIGLALIVFVVIFYFIIYKKAD